MAEKKPSGKSGGKPSEKPSSGPLSSAFKDWLEFDWLLKKRTFFKIVFWTVVGLAVLNFVVRPQVTQQSGLQQSRQTPAFQVQTRQNVQIPLDPRSWTEVRLSPQATVVSFPANAHVDIRPSRRCNGTIDFGDERAPIYFGTPTINRPMPTQVAIYGQGSVFFQAQPALPMRRPSF